MTQQEDINLISDYFADAILSDDKQHNHRDGDGECGISSDENSSDNHSSSSSSSKRIRLTIEMKGHAAAVSYIGTTLMLKQA